MQSDGMNSMIGIRQIYSIRHALGLAAFLILAMVGVPAYAQAPKSAIDEYQVKAAFLYQFAQFVEWPADALGESGRPFSVCVLGEDRSNGAIESTIKGKKVKGHLMQVTYLTHPNSTECHILFVASAEKKRWKRLSDTVRSMPILTIGEGSEFIELTGMIALVTEQNRIRFEINVAPGERAGLHISSKLLALAKVVHATPFGGK